MSAIDKDLFDLFMAKKSDVDLFGQIEALIAKRVHDAVGKENAAFYADLSRLSNSINNAGCEERRSEQIAFISQRLGVISDKYEDFLP